MFRAIKAGNIPKALEWTERTAFSHKSNWADEQFTAAIVFHLGDLDKASFFTQMAQSKTYHVSDLSTQEIGNSVDQLAKFYSSSLSRKVKSKITTDHLKTIYSMTLSSSKFRNDLRSSFLDELLHEFSNRLSKEQKKNLASEAFNRKDLKNTLFWSHQGSDRDPLSLQSSNDEGS